MQKSQDIDRNKSTTLSSKSLKNDFVTSSERIGNTIASFHLIARGSPNHITLSPATTDKKK